MDPNELPHLWQKPSVKELIVCLRKFKLEPPVWGTNASQEDASAVAEDRREINRFLSSIISSNLTWIENETDREEVWNTASQRLAARCGRTAMGEFVRVFPFVHEDGSDFQLIIREPPITGEALGLKTWGSSYVLAKLLPEFAQGSLRPALDAQRNSDAPVLELGSGTGLLGLAAASFWRVPVLLTDLPLIMENLIHNVYTNEAAAERLGGQVGAAKLVWGNKHETDERFWAHHQHQIVLAADPLYDDDHPTLLAQVIHEQLAQDTSARALVMVPLRDSLTRTLVSAFEKELSGKSHPLFAVDQGVVQGQDDWGDGDDERQQVSCWWSVFARML